MPGKSVVEKSFSHKASSGTNYSITVDDLGPEKVIEVYDPKIGMRGFLVIDNTFLGVGKGGVRMTPDVTKEEVFRLARVMTLKNSLAGVPFGGAKAGIVWEGGDDNKKKEYVQSFARAIHRLVPDQYITAPDISTGEKEMQWFVEAVGDFKGATGKPASYCKEYNGVKHCGIPHEAGSTGYGVAQSAKAAVELAGLDMNNTTVAIHGFGNVGSFAFKFLSEMGAKITAIADKDTGLYAEKGLPSDLFEHASKRLPLAEYQGVEKIAPEKVLEISADMLIPASATDVIHSGNKESIKAKIVVQGGNIVMREELEEEFLKKGVLIVPDFVANSGGVLSSYSEHRGHNLEKMFQLLDEKMYKNTKAVLEASINTGLSPRKAGLGIARERILKAMHG